MTRKELQKLLKDRGLASYGTRQQLVQRLLDGRRWFLKQSPNAAATSELTLELKFPVKLSPNQAALHQLAFVRIETTRTAELYVYEPIAAINEDDVENDVEDDVEKLVEKLFALLSINGP